MKKIYKALIAFGVTFIVLALIFTVINNGKLNDRISTTTDHDNGDTFDYAVGKDQQIEVSGLCHIDSMLYANDNLAVKGHCEGIGSVTNYLSMTVFVFYLIVALAAGTVVSFCFLII